MITRPRKHPRSNSSPDGEDRAPKRPAYSEPTVALPNGIQHDYADYTVAIMCALDFEMSAVRWMLDRQHHPLPEKKGDRNLYVLGELSGHNVVIACLPGTQGKSAAAHVAADLERTFPRVQYRLLVGIGGGVPSDKHDIRLGDVVVSMPDGQYGGVVQYDLGKDTEDGFNLKGSLHPPPRMLTNAVGLMKSDHYAKQNRIPEFISEMTRREPNLLSFYQRPSADSDILFRSGSQQTLDQDTCAQSNQSETVLRHSRLSSDPKIYYGLIASGDRVLKSAHKRDSIRDKIGDILCFEMEACGLVTELPYMVIRGISDYADSHKNDQWQPYAAAVAAGCAKELLSYLHVHTTPATLSLDSEEDVTASRRSIGGAVKFTEEQRQKLFESLDFDQFNARQKTIKLAHKKTCRWLLGREEYRNWFDVTKREDHHGFLWIKGKPGTGKSTIMNFAHIEAKRKMKDKIVISFFFNARGTDLEKSTIGMYQSLLLQLLQNFSGLQEVLLGCLETLGMNIRTSVEHLRFTIDSLKYLFREAVHSLDHHSLVCFIDALDECSEEEVRDMISFFQEVNEYGDNVGESLHFQVCFSSRHYPHISIDRGLSLILEGQEGHNQDIVNYIIDKLKIGNSKAAQDIRDLLQEKASGVFMWVVLVVDILNKEYDRGRIMGLRNRLRDIPSDLHELFRDIISRDSNGGDKDVLLLCIQWVLFARQPLTPEQFYFAMHSGIAPESLCEWDAEEITQDVMKRFILDSSKGLAETTRSKNPTVQFIHESVVDFLLKKNGFAEIWGGIGTNFRGLSHERLKSCCVNYMNIDLSAYIQPETEIPEASSKEAKTLRESVIRAFPLMEYATYNVLYHSDCAEEMGITQGEFLQNFHMPRWVLLDNVLEKHQIRRHTQHLSLLYLLAELNAPNLAKVHPQVMFYLEIEKGRYGTPLFAALAMGNRAVVCAFLGAHAAQQPSSGHLSELYNLYCRDDSRPINFGRNFSFSKPKGILFHLIELDDEIVFQFALDICPDILNGRYHTQPPLLWAAKHGHENTVKFFLREALSNINTVVENGSSFGFGRDYDAAIKLLLEHSDANTRDQSGRTVLSYAAEAGHRAMVTVLLESYGADVNIVDEIGRTPLSYAAEYGRDSIVKLLLEKMDPNSKDHQDRTPLSYAAQYGYDSIVKLLLEKVDPNSKDHQDRTPLSYAAQYGRYSIVKLLLEKVDPNSKDHQDRTPLSYAAQYGRYSIVKLLLEKVDPSSKDYQGRTPLSYAAQYGYDSTIKLLLETADPNLKDHQGRTPLSYAAQIGHDSTIKLLLETADPNLKDHDGRTPLSYAAQYGRDSIVKLLLEKVDPNSKDHQDRTPLSYAAQYGHDATINLLLETADPNLKDHQGRTPLSYAAQHGYGSTIKLLLETADPDLKDHDSRTPLSYAAQYAYDDSIIKLLLETADPDLKDHQGRTPLSYAAQYGYGSTIKLLLETADPDLKDHQGRTPLSYAAQYGYGSTIKLLLETADPDLKDHDGRTPLSYAAQNGRDIIVKVLLEKVDPNSKDHQDRTPLSYAAQYGHDSIVKSLLEKADPNSKDHWGQTPLLCAARMGNETIVELLLKHVNFDPDSYKTAISHALAGEQIRVAKLLLDHGETAVKGHQNSDNALAPYAARNIYDTMLEELVTKADMDTNQILLTIAAAHGYDSLLKLLLEKSGVDVNTRDFFGCTPLFEAVKGQKTSIVELLLAAEGVDVNLPDNLGFTPFSVAAQRGYEEIGRLLLLTNKVDPAIIAEYPDFTFSIRKL
jgi:ankyrin repeat protein/nucleoside phosphorylase